MSLLNETDDACHHFCYFLPNRRRKGQTFDKNCETIYRSFKTISFCVNATGEMNRSNNSERTILWIERILFSSL